jgi:hypothetical protein
MFFRLAKWALSNLSPICDTKSPSSIGPSNVVLAKVSRNDATIVVGRIADKLKDFGSLHMFHQCFIQQRYQHSLLRLAGGLHA